MAKSNPWDLRGLARQEARTFVLSDPKNPGLAFTLTLRKLGPAEQMSSVLTAREYERSYVTGIGPTLADGTIDKSSSEYRPPVMLAPVDGQQVFLTYGTCRTLVAVMDAQDGPEADKYTFEELAAMCVSPHLQAGIVNCYLWALSEFAEAGDDPSPLPESTEAR